MSKKKTQEEFKYELFKKTNGTISTNDIYKNNRTKMNFYCDKYHYWQTTADSVVRQGTSCPYCSGYKVWPGFNDMWTTHPDIAALLKNPDEGSQYSYSSNKKTEFVCPNCGYIVCSRISNVYFQGLSCPICSDGLSYPNKFMANILSQLDINFESEYSPDWICPLRYDFYFLYNNNQYIVEMDGGVGHGHSCGGCFEKDLIQSKEIDDYKDKLALEHCIKVIRIDCNYCNVINRRDYIQNNILHSILYNILDLSKVNFDQCDINAQKSIFVDVYREWDNGNHNIDNIALKYRVSIDTVKNYLIRSEQNGFSSYCHKEYLSNAKKKKIEKLKKTTGTPVQCIETGDVFWSIAYVKQTLGINVWRAQKDQNCTAGMLSDGTKLHWRKLTEYEAALYKNTHDYNNQKISHKYLNQT